jgi:hypothetical protein
MGFAALSGCAPTVWDRPSTTPAQFSMDDDRCWLMAEGANPDLGVPAINTGAFKRDLAANAAARFVHRVAQGPGVCHTHDLCLQANGYIAGEQGAPTAPAATPMTSLIPIAYATPAAFRPGRSPRVAFLRCRQSGWRWFG